METASLAMHMTFTPEDLAWVQQNGVTVPPFWSGHPIGPALGDVVRLADRQFVVMGRAWEHNGQQPVLRLYMSASTPRSDTSLH
jgi:hypothetical protein